MTKIMTIIGTRPEIIKMSAVIGNKINNEPIFISDDIYKADDELNEVFFNDVRIPDTQRLGNEGDGWSSF